MLVVHPIALQVRVQGGVVVRCHTGCSEVGPVRSVVKDRSTATEQQRQWRRGGERRWVGVSHTSV